MHGVVTNEPAVHRVGSARRRAAVAIVAFSLAAVVLTLRGGATGAAAATAGDWPQFRHDARNSGRNPTERLLSRSNVGRLRVAWSYAAGRGSGISSSSVAVVGGNVFVSTDDGALHAVRAATGRRLWRLAVSTVGTSSAPAVADGRVHVLTLDSRLFAVSTSGRRLWSVRLSTGIGGYTGSPVVDGGTVFTVCEAPGARDARTGAPLWQREDLICTGCTPAAADGVVYIGAGPAFESAPSRQAVHALDARTGATRWSTSVDRLVFSGFASPAVDADSVYIRGFTDPAETRTHTLLALDRASGRVRWRASLGRAAPVGFSIPAIAGTTVLYPSTDRRLYAFDTRSGRRRWVVTVGPTDGSPTVANGVVYLVTASRRLLVIDLRNGRRLASLPVGRAMPAAGGSNPSAAVAGGTVYVPTNVRSVLAFRPSSRGT